LSLGAGSGSNIFVDCDCNSLDTNVTLPAASSSEGVVVCIKVLNAGVNDCELHAAGTDGIDGQASWVTAVDNEWLRVVCDGSTWHIIGADDLSSWT
jgi:hypothetical protein